MKKILATIIALLFSVATLHATSLTGSIKYPDGTGVTGRIAFKLVTQGIAITTGSCAGPFAIVPTGESVFTITNGTIGGSPTVEGNDCILPANTYYIVTVRDSGSQILFSENWTITGTTIDVGTIVPSGGSGTSGFSGAVLLTPPGAADQAITGNILAQITGTYDLGSSAKSWRDLWLTRTANVESSYKLKVNTVSGGLGLANWSGSRLNFGDSKTSAPTWVGMDFYPGTAIAQLTIDNGGLRFPPVDTSGLSDGSHGRIYFDGAVFKVCELTVCTNMLGTATIGGSGTTNTLTKFTGSTTLGDSGLTEISSVLATTDFVKIGNVPSGASARLSIGGNVIFYTGTTNASTLTIQQSTPGFGTLTSITTGLTDSGSRQDLSFDATGGTNQLFLSKDATHQYVFIGANSTDALVNANALIVGGPGTGDIVVASASSNASILRLLPDSITSTYTGAGTATFLDLIVVNGARIRLGTTPYVFINEKLGVGAGFTSPTARLHLYTASDGSANTAPMKLQTTSATLLATPEPGAIETDGASLYFTDSSGNRITLGSSGGSVTAAGMHSNGGVFATGTNAISSTLALTDGQLMIGVSGSTPATANIFNLGGITITNGPGTISIGVQAQANQQILYGTGSTGFTSASNLQYDSGSGTFKVGVAQINGNPNQAVYAGYNNNSTLYTPLHISGSGINLNLTASNGSGSPGTVAFLTRAGFDGSPSTTPLRLAVDGNLGTVAVSIAGADSCGSGFRCLRVPN